MKKTAEQTDLILNFEDWCPGEIEGEMERALVPLIMQINTILAKHNVWPAGLVEVKISSPMSTKLIMIENTIYGIKTLLELFNDTGFLSLFYPEDTKNEKIANQINQERINLINIILSSLYSLQEIYKDKDQVFERDNEVLNIIYHLLDDVNLISSKYERYQIQKKYKTREAWIKENNIEVILWWDPFNEIVDKEYFVSRLGRDVERSMRSVWWSDETLSRQQKTFIDKIIFFLIGDENAVFPNILQLVLHKDLPSEIIIKRIEESIQWHKESIKRDFFEEIKEYFPDWFEATNLDENDLYLHLPDEKIKACVEKFEENKMVLADLDETIEWIPEVVDYLISHFRNH